MGTGKTTVGRAVAQRLGFACLDSDHEIERLRGPHDLGDLRDRGRGRLPAPGAGVHRARPSGRADGGRLRRRPGRSSPACSSACANGEWSSACTPRSRRSWPARGARTTGRSCNVDDPASACRALYAEREPIYRRAGTLVLTDGRPLREVVAHVVRVWRREAAEFARARSGHAMSARERCGGGSARSASTRSGSRRVAPPPAGGLRAWLAAGHQADMALDGADGGRRLGARTGAAGGPDRRSSSGVNYCDGRPGAAGAGAPVWARYARYSDYHDTIRPALARAGALLEEIYGAGPRRLPLVRGHRAGRRAGLGRARRAGLCRQERDADLAPPRQLAVLWRRS